MEPMQQTIFGTEEPMPVNGQQFADPEREARIGRRDVNRGLFQNRISPARADAAVNSTGGFSNLAQRGVEPKPKVQKLVGRYLPGPNENGAWSRMSQRTYVPRNELGSIQNYVSDARVQEIRDDPSTANNPRFPEGHEVPRTYSMPNPKTPSGTQHVLVNGNHRTAAALDSGALFVETQDIPATKYSQGLTRAYRDLQDSRFRSARQRNRPHAPAIERPTLEDYQKKGGILGAMGIRRG